MHARVHEARPTAGRATLLGDDELGVPCMIASAVGFADEDLLAFLG
jgi:hypothetical protein